MAKLDTSTIQTSGDLGGEQINMSLDTDSLVHIIGSIASLYGDIHVAIVRELITNAIDSHIEAGNPSPVHVSTPSNLSPNLVIQDYGLGMSRAEVESVWAKVGYSTKRNSNATAGRYGYGRISPLAYGSQSMTVVTVKNGEKTTFVVGSDATSGGLIEVVDVSQTDEPNSYRASVLVSDRYDHSTFENAAQHFAKFSTFPVIVNGRPASEPISVFANGVFKEFDFRSYGEGDYVVQGNVAYPIQASQLDSRYNGGSNRLHSARITGIYVPVGEVDVTPSRDGLKYTKKTIDNLNKYYEKYNDERYKGIVEEIKNAPTRYSAIKRFSNYRGWLTKHHYDTEISYKGRRIPQSLQELGLVSSRVLYDEPRPGEYERVKRIKTGYLSPSDRRASTGQLDPSSIGSETKTLVILNYPNKTFTRVHLAKTLAYSKTLGMQVEPCIEVATEFDDSMFWWYENEYMVEWDDIKPTKVNLNSLGAKKKAVKTERKWEGIGGDDIAMGLHQMVPDKTKEILYISKTDAMDGGRVFRVSKIEHLYDADTQVFLVYDSQQERFCALYPQARPAYTRYIKKIEEFLASLSKDDIGILRASERFYGLRPVVDQLEDPALRACCVGTATYDSPLKQRNAEMKNLVSRIPDEPTRNRLLSAFPKKETTDLASRYPLLKLGYVSDDVRYSNHAVKYCNLIYREMKKNGEL